MDSCQPGCSERAHTQTSTWASSHITPWCTRWQCAEKICIQLPGTEKEKEHAAKALQNNGYPRRLVVWRPTSQPPLPEQDTPTATVTLPYICHLLETIQRILAPLRIHTCSWPHRTLRQTLVRLKDQTPHCNNEPVSTIYWIPCSIY